LKRLTLSRQKRLRGNRQFKAVIAGGVRVSDDLLSVCVAENNFRYCRLGVSVGKSCGKAVFRNRLKRVLREAFRQNQDRIPGGFDYVIMISPFAVRELRERRDSDFVKKLNFHVVSESLLKLLDKAMVKRGIEQGKSI